VQLQPSPEALSYVSPDGSVSVTTIVPWASEGPALLTLMKYSPSVPAVKGPLSALVMLRSALVLEESVAVLVSSPGSGSGVDVLSVAVLLKVLGCTSLASPTVRVMTLAGAPATMGWESEQFTVPAVSMQVQSVPVAPP
jgi:hypothetical protein